MSDWAWFGLGAAALTAVAVGAVWLASGSDAAPGKGSAPDPKEVPPAVAPTAAAQQGTPDPVAALTSVLSAFVPQKTGYQN